MVLEAVFGFKEAGLKLDVTTWAPRFTQSVYVMHQSFVSFIFLIPNRFLIKLINHVNVCEIINR